MESKFDESADTEPIFFREALNSISMAKIRPEIVVSKIKSPQKLAPYSSAIIAELTDDNESNDTFARLIFLFDPDGVENWEGVLRCVFFCQADIEQDVAQDPLLPEVAWSWLHDSIDAEGPYRALGGTVTATSSFRYGDVSGPERLHQIEIRASWTVIEPNLAPHVEAMCKVIELASGLPPVGVSIIHK